MRNIVGFLWSFFGNAGHRRRSLLGLPAGLAVLLIALTGLGPTMASGGPPGSNPPSRPGPVSAVPLTTQEVYLSWLAPNGRAPLSAYVITRDGRDVATVSADTLTYADNSVQASRAYVYGVIAVDAAGRRSQPSASGRIKTPAPPETADNTPPSPPENLEAAATGGGVTLAWEDSTDDTGIGGYFVRRDGRLIATLDPAQRTYVDTSVNPSTAYTYAVEAIDVVGHHSQPSLVTASTGQFSQTASAPAGGSAPTGSTLSRVWGALSGLVQGTLSPAASAASSLPTGYNAALRRYPYLTDLVQGYVTVNWATDSSGITGSVTYGQVGSEDCTAHSVAATYSKMTVNSVTEYQWKAMLALTAGTQYCYRVFLGSTDLLGTNTAPTFWTQVPQGSTAPFSFAVLGDWGSVDTTGSNPSQASLMSHLAASGARFALTVGDNVYPSGSQTEYGDLVQTGSNISAVFGPQFYANVGASMAIFPNMGNHGMARSETIHPHLQNWPQDRAVSTSGGRYQIDTYCCINGTTSGNYPSAWYAFDAGIARFYVLEVAWPNSNVGTGTLYSDDYGYHWTASSAEYQWLQNDLATHPSQLKFVTWHFPLYSDNVNESTDTYLHGASSLEGLLNQFGVNIVFDGHSHNYEHFLAPSSGSEMSYLSGGAGAQLTPINACSSFDEYAIGWSYSANTGSACHTPLPTSVDQVYHYLLVTVNGTTVTIAPTNAQGQTFDVKTYTFGSPSNTPTPTPTATSAPAATPTPTATATSAPAATPTPTPTATSAPAATPTPTATATPAAAPPVFSDGFESGNMAAWTTNSGLVVESSTVHSGGFAAEANTTSAALYARKTLPSTYGDSYYRVYFNRVSAASQVNLLRIRMASGASIGALFVAASGTLGLRNDVAAVTYNSVTTIGAGWHSLELHATINGASSTTQVWLDGVQVNDLSLTTNFGSTPVAAIQLGDSSGSKTYDVAYDDVVFDVKPIGP